MFEEPQSDAALLETMSQAQRAERKAIAARLLAAGRLCRHRMSAVDAADRAQWCVDNWEAVSAEVAAELGISQGRASSQMNYGVQLIERLPKLGTLFASGAIEYRIVIIAVFRTGLITDADILDAVDTRLAQQATRWNTCSEEKLKEKIDWFVRELDPHAVRLARQADDDRHIETAPAADGMAEIYGRVRASDAAAFDQRLNQLRRQCAATTHAPLANVGRMRWARGQTATRRCAATADPRTAQPAQPTTPGRGRSSFTCWPTARRSPANRTLRRYCPGTGRFPRKP